MISNTNRFAVTTIIIIIIVVCINAGVNTASRHRLYVVESREVGKFNDEFVKRQIFCNRCQATIQKLFIVLSQPDVREEVQNYLVEYLCPVFKNYKNICINFVNAQWLTVWKILLFELSQPRMLCAQFHLCLHRSGTINKMTSYYVIKE